MYKNRIRGPASAGLGSDPLNCKNGVWGKDLAATTAGSDAWAS
jgi:hypothetical protein